MNWRFKTTKGFTAKNVILIEGLPGIGNVGKIATDLLVNDLKARKVVDIFSYSLPNSVFVNEKSLVELPKIEIFYKKWKNQDFLFLTGDVQPINEESSYELAEKILDLVVKYGCKEIITLGGIGLPEVPQKPKVYCTGNSLKLIKEFDKLGVNTKVYGVVGPIIGISGLLLGLSEKRKIPAASLLTQTFGHPMYVGLKSAKETLKVLVKRYGFNISIGNLDKEIKNVEKELQEIDALSQKHQTLNKLKRYKEMTYIG
ncbi:MAG: PAC2 family protein [archaeon]